VDMRDWEIGAMILANTWSDTWGDSGRAYTLYRNLALKVSEGGISNGQVYVVIPDITVKPELTLKLTLQHELRDRILIRIGISEYMKDSLPEYEYTFSCLNKRGGGYPIQGVNSDPIEMGLDVSSMLHHPDLEAVKFFLTVVEEDEDTSASGEILSWSLIDLRNGQKEYKATDVNLEIRNNGITRSSLVLGNPDIIPYNLTAVAQGADYLLNWNKPADENGLSGYMIFMDDEEFLFVTDSFKLLSNVPNGTRFKVKAKYGTEYTPPSNTVVIANQLYLPVAGSGYCLKYDGFDDCVDCGNGINIAKHDFTIEFWARRDADPSNEFVIGGGKWNKTDQGLHIGFRDNKLMCGFWGDDVHTDEVYTDPDWHHWVITYDTTTMMQYIYRDGEVAGERKATGHFRGTGKLYIGCMSGNTWFYQGELDEVRVWNYVRSHEQIMEYMYMPLKGTEEGLLGYWKFDERSGYTLTDHSDSIDQGTLNGFSDKAWVNSEAWANRSLKSLEDTILVYSGYSKNGSWFSCSITESAAYGNLEIDSINKQISYLPNQLFQGTDVFEFSIKENVFESFYSVKINAFFPQSINAAEHSIIKVYPNPFVDHIRLEAKNEAIRSIRLVSIDGREIFNRRYSSPIGNQYDIFVPDLPKGVYSLILQSGTGIKTYRLLKVE
ncbi:LamG-like jellyroll fold domain-containing protein, partial [Bacteroidota bacterium]